MMETLLKEINKILEVKNEAISLLEYEVKYLKEANEKLNQIINTYKENEVKEI